MAKDFLGDAEREATQSLAFKRWIAMRVENIHAKVSAEDVFARNGVPLSYGGHRPEQIFCPFHGNTKTMAARFFPRGDSPAHVWCYVCKERWDAITLWKKFADFEGPFTRLLHDIERAFGIEVPEAPARNENFEEPDDLDAELVQFYDICERRLKGAKTSFTMEGYLRIGSVLDRLAYRKEVGKITTVEARATLQQILVKIGEKERGCPDRSS